MISLAINQANTGFMLLAASLVMLMTPGLAFFYGGLVGRKNMLTIMIQSFVSMGITTVHLVAGRLLAVLQRRRGRDLRQLRPRIPARRRPPTSIFDAVAHPAGRVHRLPDDVRDHHAGPDHGRLHEPGHVQGLPDLPRRVAAVRLLPVRPHDLGRRLARPVGRARLRRRHRGARDRPAWPRWRRCSTSASAGASTPPHSIPLVALGTGLLWFGWYGFNAGSELKVDAITALGVPEHRRGGVVRRRRPGSSSSGATRGSRTSSGC